MGSSSQCEVFYQQVQLIDIPNFSCFSLCSRKNLFLDAQGNLKVWFWIQRLVPTSLLPSYLFAWVPTELFLKKNTGQNRSLWRMVSSSGNQPRSTLLKKYWKSKKIDKYMYHVSSRQGDRETLIYVADDSIEVNSGD